MGKGLNQFISDQVNNRLKAALSDNGEERDSSSEPTVAEEQVDLVDGLETTEEELQAFRIIQAIVAQDVDPNRIYYRDAKSYCAILFDDNNRKAVCRLRFNNTDRLRVGLIKEDKSEDVRDLDRVTDLYSFADQIREAARRYL